jgi:hypothetical protein
MMSQWRALMSAAILTVAAAVMPATAHHSFAMYDNDQTVTVDGTVAEFRWGNPHVVIVVSGKSTPEAADQLWTLELPAPGQLTRNGWTHSTLKSGDKVKVELHPFRDGRAGGAFVSVTTSDGQKMTR